jgi:exopolysaccharide biosynthesis WecB/TagA/CpsF family protein
MLDIVKKMEKYETRVLTIKNEYRDLDIYSRQCFSFLNFASLSGYFKQYRCSSILYFCDGMLMAWLCTLVTGTRIKRVSFDFTSLAAIVFSEASTHGLPVYLIGAEENEIVSFLNKLNHRFPSLRIVGFHSGYFSDQEKIRLIGQIIESQAAVVVAGLGAGKQEDFLHHLHQNGYAGTSFSCGGFIRQEAFSKQEYYPTWINKLNLRAFYRMYREPHTIRRYLLDYPKNLVIFLYLHLTGKLRVIAQ